MRTLATALVILFAAGVCHAGIKGEEVTYSAEGVTLKGFLAYDTAREGRRPAVLVVHEWWGHNEYARTRARMLAELGYTALAVDMYGDGKQADHPEDAGKFAGEVMKKMPVAKARFLAATDFLKAHETVDQSRIVAIGYCFGGGVVLAMARQGVDLRGVVSFHGSLHTLEPAAAGAVKARILVCHGAADSFIPPEVIKAFKDEMKSAGADLTFIAYPGAKHSFTNPAATELGKKFKLDIAYNKKADRKSWNDMKAFLRKVLK